MAFDVFFECWARICNVFDGRMGEGYESEGNEMEFDREVFLQAPFSVSGKESWLGVWGELLGDQIWDFRGFFLFLQSLLLFFLIPRGR